MSRLQAYAPQALAVLRIVTALLFIQHGLQKLFMWPPSPHHPDPVPLLSLAGIGGLLELVGGLLILAGLFTRPVAFVLSGEMAVAYWMFHFVGGMNMPNGWMPVVNGGDSAIQFCFTFLYLVFAGAGSWSVDAARAPRAAEAA
ncbi:DoxX family protein [Sphingosinicella terrae]|uniref:DoxX family protein n=1 Tax=Sphingosinicella terrae TaxID=2172047 RepID=UPI000E0CDE57|nr:DoxX family protein [Sphingosinicella terrae]